MIDPSTNDLNTWKGQILRELFDIYIADHLPHLANLESETEARFRRTQEFNFLLEKEANLIEDIEMILQLHQQEIIQQWVAMVEMEMKVDSETKEYMRLYIESLIADKKIFNELIKNLEESIKLQQEIQAIYKELSRTVDNVFERMIASTPNIILSIPEANVNIEFHDMARKVSQELALEVALGKVTDNNFDQVYNRITNKVSQSYLENSNLDGQDKMKCANRIEQWYDAKSSTLNKAEIKNALKARQPVLMDKMQKREKIDEYKKSIIDKHKINLPINPAARKVISLANLSMFPNSNAHQAQPQNPPQNRAGQNIAADQLLQNMNQIRRKR